MRPDSAALATLVPKRHCKAARKSAAEMSKGTAVGCCCHRRVNEVAEKAICDGFAIIHKKPLLVLEDV